MNAAGTLPTDFPSDEDVEAAVKAIHLSEYDEDTRDFADQDWDELADPFKEHYRINARAALQAVAESRASRTTGPPARRTEEE